MHIINTCARTTIVTLKHFPFNKSPVYFPICPPQILYAVVPKLPYFFINVRRYYIIVHITVPMEHHPLKSKVKEV